MIDSADTAAVERQIGREPRGMLEVAHRCPCGKPDVVITAPRLDDGTPFPTVYYLTCPKACSAVGRMEGSGLMRDMERRLADDSELAGAYARAHASYLARRNAIADVPEIAGVSAGGMPDRVKCLHVLLAQALAEGPGANPLGDEVRVAIGEWWEPTPCE